MELTEAGITWTGDSRHQQLLEEHFGMNDDTKVLNKNGYDDEPQGEEKIEDELSVEESKGFRMVAARLNYMAQDNMYLQYAAKEICLNMAKPDDTTS